jgi:hypothetical protein
VALAGLLSAPLLHAEDILSGLGGFEQPSVSARTPQEKGGDPSLTKEHGLFSTFIHKNGEKEGVVNAGLTSEIALSGSQSFFVEVDNLSANSEGTTLQTNFVPLMPDHPYTIRIWGKMDPKKPFLMKKRPLYLKLQADFFAADKTTQVGDTVYLTQPIPGTPNRDAFYNDKTWSELVSEFTSPPDAAYATVSWRWETGTEQGAVSGRIFFDNFTFDGDMPEVPLIQAIKEPAEPTDDAASQTEAPATTGTAGPATTGTGAASTSGTAQ